MLRWSSVPNAAGQEDTDLDTVIRICPFRVFGNFSTLLNYRVSCLHSPWASVAPLVLFASRGRGTFPVQNTFSISPLNRSPVTGTHSSFWQIVFGRRAKN